MTAEPSKWTGAIDRTGMAEVDWFQVATECTRKCDQKDAEIARLKAALIRLRDCDFVITPADRMDAVREIARAALLAETKEKL